MKTITFTLGLAALLIASTIPAHADTTAAPASEKTAASATGAAKTVSIDTAGMDLRDALKSLSAQSGAKILIGPEVMGKLASKLENVPLETALSVAATVTGNRWSKIQIPADKVEALTAEKAVALVLAADTLATSAASVQTAGAPAVAVGAAAPASPNLTTVYIVLTKVDPAVIRAAREDAKKRSAAQAAQDAATAKMSDDARKDPGVVNAFSALQSLSPDQIAVVAREYFMNASPEMRQAIGDALRQQREQYHDQAHGEGDGQGNGQGNGQGQ